jgi:hypothetical protein
MSLIAIFIYLWFSFASVAAIAYGYFQWRQSRNKNDLLLMQMGFAGVIFIIYGLITRQLILSNTGNVPFLLLSRQVLGFVALLIGLALLWRQYGKRRK